MFFLEADRVIPHRQLRILLRSTRQAADQSVRTAAEMFGDERALAFYAEGRFLYLHAGEQFERRFLVPLLQLSDRIVKAEPVEECLGDRTLIEGMFLG
jgi:hypothetical protein